MGYLIIVATGRSGSTTLQRIINTIPDTLVNGENGGTVFKLMEAYTTCSNIQETTNYPKPYSEMVEKNIWPAMYNTADVKKVKSSIKELILAFFPKDKRTRGFKEVTLLDRMHLLDLISCMIPGIKIILNIREDVESQSKSRWHAKNEKSVDKLTDLNNTYREYYKNHTKNCFLVTFEDLFKEEKIQELFKFLGAEFNQEEYKKIINNNLDFTDKEPRL